MFRDTRKRTGATRHPHPRRLASDTLLPSHKKAHNAADVWSLTKRVMGYGPCTQPWVQTLFLRQIFQISRHFKAFFYGILRLF